MTSRQYSRSLLGLAFPTRKQYSLMQNSASPLPGTTAIFVNSFGEGGAEKIAVMQANGLAESGEKVDILVERDTGSYRKLLRPEVRVVNFNSRNPLTIFGKLIAYTRATPPMAILCHLEKPSLIAIAAGFFSGYRKVIPILEVNLDSYAKMDHQVRRQFLRLLLAIFYRFAPRIISVSQGCTDSLAKLLGAAAGNIETVYNGFDLEGLRAASRQPVAHPLLAEKTKPTFISAGRLADQKNFQLLIRAFAKVRSQRDCSLIILGEGHLRAELEALAATLGVAGDVHLPGFQPNPMAWFSKCEAYVMSSKAEGLASVLIEALATGTRVISTNCPSGPSEIIQDNKYGILVPVDDVAALALAMQTVLDNNAPNATPQTQVQAYLDRTFSFNQMMARYRAVVQAVAGAGRSAP